MKKSENDSVNQEPPVEAKVNTSETEEVGSNNGGSQFPVQLPDGHVRFAEEVSRVSSEGINAAKKGLEDLGSGMSSVQEDDSGEGEGGDDGGTSSGLHVAQAAGEFLGAMRKQKGSVGQEAESFSKGFKSTAETFEKVWTKMPDETKDTVAKGAEGLANTVERLWTKVFGILEKTLDWIDKNLFPQEKVDSDSEEDDEWQGADSGEPVSGGNKCLSFLGLRERSKHEVKRMEREKRKKQKHDAELRAKRRNLMSFMFKLTGAILGFLVVTMLFFSLGFVLLPILFVGVITGVLALQFYACCTPLE